MLFVDKRVDIAVDFQAYVLSILYLLLELFGNCVDDLCLLTRMTTVNEDMQKRMRIQEIPAIKLTRCWKQSGALLV